MAQVPERIFRHRDGVGFQLAASGAQHTALPDREELVLRLDVLVVADTAEEFRFETGMVQHAQLKTRPHKRVLDCVDALQRAGDQMKGRGVGLFITGQLIRQLQDISSLGGLAQVRADGRIGIFCTAWVMIQKVCPLASTSAA